MTRISVAQLSAMALVCVLSTGCGGSSPSTSPSSNAGSSTAKTLTSKANPTAAAGNGGGGLFTAAEPWTADVSASTVSDRSEAIIAALNELGGWGGGNQFQTDFSITVFEADASTPKVNVVATKGEQYCGGGPDCTPLPVEMPIPEDATIEGSKDLRCDISGKTEGQEDCHLLVADRAENKLYEAYQANKVGDELTVGGLFVWDLDKAYPETLRGDQCTSADAAGFPIAGLTPTADEVATGTIDHAIRFILPNDRMKKEVYVRPATHAGGPDSDNPNAPPYGVRFRLKPDFDDSSFSEGGKTVIAALKKYGMLLSDGGQIPLTFADDRTSTAKWVDLGIEAQTFNAITPDQFDVVELGEEIPLTYDCVPES